MCTFSGPTGRPELNGGKGIMRGTIRNVERRVKLGVAAAGIALMAGAAGWGGSLALSSADTPSVAAPNTAATVGPTASPATSARTETRATTAPATTSTPTTPSPAEVSVSTPTGRTSAAPERSGSPSLAVASSQVTHKPDIVFVSPTSDDYSGQWSYRIGLLGFPPDTVIEISGYDMYGNSMVAPLVMTTADGSSDPFTSRFQMNFAYGGTCDAARPATVTARGKGISITETAPRPRECDGRTTPNGPWKPPTYPTPVTSAPPSYPGAGGT
jgi:hypothetical protein